MITDPSVVVVDAGAPDAAAIARALGGELPRVGHAALAELHRAPPPDAIVVLAMASPIDAEVLDRTVAWADRATVRPGLIACVEGGRGHDAEAALAAGLDDAVAAETSPRELVARVRAVNRRVRRAAVIPEHVRCGALVLALGDRVVWVDGAPRELSRMEFAVLRALVAAGGAAMTREALLSAAWGPRGAGVGERAVDNVIVNLRRKLGPPERIHTVRGVGFRLTR